MSPNFRINGAQPQAKTMGLINRVGGVPVGGNRLFSFSLKHLLAVVTCVAIFLAVFLPIYRRAHDFSRNDLDRLRPGMTKDVVIKAIGKPNGKRDEDCWYYSDRESHRKCYIWFENGGLSSRSVELDESMTLEDIGE